jgi:hypothetical protein
MRKIASLLASGILCSVTLLATDLTGIWVGQIPGRNGDVQDIAFKFTQKGTTLAGKLYGDYQSSRIVEGKIAGDQISFLVIAAEQSGNQINDSKLRFSGTLKDGEVELTREREGVTTAGNGGDVQMKTNPKLTFRLKRLI